MTVTTPEAPPPGLFSVIPMPPAMDDLPAPAKGPYYVLAEDDVLIHKQNHWGRFLQPTAKAPALAKAPEAPTMWRNDERLPAELLGQIWHFFRHAWNSHKSEAMVYLTFDKERGYSAFVPPQTTSHAHVSATLNPDHIRQGTRIVGTVHSHCDFNGFHSGTDEADAREHDGLHITIGHVDRGDPDVAVMISNNGTFWDTKLETVIDGELVLTPHPAWWNRYINHPDAPQPTAWNGNGRKQPTTLADFYDDEEAWMQQMGMWRTGHPNGKMQAPATPKPPAATPPASTDQPTKYPVTTSYGNLDMAIANAIDHGTFPAEIEIEDPDIQNWINEIKITIADLKEDLALFGIYTSVLFTPKKETTTP